VSSVELWSAATLLDARVHTDRQLFTYDATDTTGNGMKHFCMPADTGATWCNDGAGLTASEASYFDPSIIALSQEPEWTTAGTAHTLGVWQSMYETVIVALPRNLSDFIRWLSFSISLTILAIL